MNWTEHNIEFKKSEYDIDCVVYKNGERWRPAQSVTHAFHELLIRFAEALRQSAEPTPLIIKVNKGGLALRGHGSSDVCWIDITRADFVVKWNDNLFRNRPSFMQGQDRYQTRRVSSLMEVPAALAFCVSADNHMAHLGGNPVIRAQLSVKKKQSRHLPVPAATPPKALAMAQPSSTSPVLPTLPDIRRVCDALLSAMVSFADSRHMNGLRVADLITMPAIKWIPHQSRREALAALCKQGLLIEDNNRYYMTTPPRELVCREEINSLESTPKRVSTIVSRIMRDSATVRQLKQLYGYRCQICGYRLTFPTSLYAEVHHLQPLGSPHNGPDVLENMIVVCPNHHVLLDYGALKVSSPDLKYAIHTLGDNFVRYHNASMHLMPRQ